MSEETTMIDNKGKKWVITGYYMDDKGMSWTLLLAADGSGKTKKVKGVL
jgi:hypothetical protein